jgi:hypothetical protein
MLDHEERSARARLPADALKITILLRSILAESRLRRRAILTMRSRTAAAWARMRSNIGYWSGFRIEGSGSAVFVDGVRRF